VVVEPVRLIDVADSHDVLRGIDTRRGQKKDIILDLSTRTALQMILAQVRSINSITSPVQTAGELLVYVTRFSVRFCVDNIKETVNPLTETLWNVCGQFQTPV